MSIINTPKPTTSLSNSTQPNKGETWSSITTRWNEETRTWLQASKLINNQGSPMIGFLQREEGGYILQENMDRIIISSGSSITNVARP
jgi:hypothetical protein